MNRTTNPDHPDHPLHGRDNERKARERRERKAFERRIADSMERHKPILDRLAESEAIIDRLSAQDADVLRALGRMTVTVNRFTLAEHVEGVMKPSYWSVQSSLGRLRALGLADSEGVGTLLWWITDEGRAALDNDHAETPPKSDQNGSSPTGGPS